MKSRDPVQVVLLPAAADAPAVRLAVAADGRLLSRDLLVADGTQAPTDRPGPRVVVVVPGTDAPARWLQLSAFSQAQARAAALALARDELAAGDATHVAVGAAVAPQASRPVVVVAEATMDAWIARVAALGLRADAMVPDHLALPGPDDPEGAVVAAWDGDWLVRTSSRSFRVEADLAATVLGEAAPTPVTGTAEVEALLARGALDASPDLLQGPYAATDERPGGVRAWRRAAGLAATLLASVPLLWAAEAISHELSARSLEAESATRVAQALPGNLQDADPVTSVRTALARERAREDFPRAFAALSSGVHQMDDVAIERISWQAGAPLRATIVHGTAEQLGPLGGFVAGHGLALVTVGTQRGDGRLLSEVELLEEVP